MAGNETNQTRFAAYRKAYSQRRASGAKDQSDDHKLVSPYVSLRHFSDTTASLLVGREKAIKGILDRMKESHVIFVVGGSGSGKSSIVRGGVLDILRSATRSVANKKGPWDAIDFRPATRPVDELEKAFYTQIFKDRLEDPEVAAKIAEISGTPAEMIWPQIKKELTFSQMPQAVGYDYATHYGLISAHQWFDTLDRALRSRRLDTPNLAVLIDQFEEIFRNNVDRKQADALFAMIRRVDSSKPPGVYLIITMRAEDLHRCARVPGLTDIVNKSLYLIDWLAPSNLREAIYQPAREILEDWRIPFGGTPATAPFDKEVTDRILADVAKTQARLEHKEDHLPLFQHALTWLWTWKLENCPADQDKHKFEITEQDFDQALATLGETDNWMKTALSRDVREGLEAAIGRYTDRTDAAGLPDDVRKVIANAALRATLCAIASKDENGRFYREFVDPEDVVRKRLSDPIFGKDDAQKTEALHAALDELVSRGFLVSNTISEKTQYDVTHEALIRNSRIFRWVNREADIIGALARSVKLDPASGTGKVSDEDLPMLKVLFDTGSQKSRKNNAKRAYERTFSPDWVHHAVERRQMQDQSDEFAAPQLREKTSSKAMSEAVDPNAADEGNNWFFVGKKLYDAKVKDVNAAQKKAYDDKRRKKRMKVTIRSLAAGLLIVVVLTSFLSGLQYRESQERNLLEGLALAKSPGERSQLVGANFHEFTRSYEAVRDRLESNNENGFKVKPLPLYAFAYSIYEWLHPTQGERSDDEIFLALVSLNERYRGTFGERYQVLPAAGIDGSESQENKTAHILDLHSGREKGDEISCVEVNWEKPGAEKDIEPIEGVRPWGLKINRVGSSDGDGPNARRVVFTFVHEDGTDNKNARPEAVGLLFHPKQKGQVCTDSRGTILTVSRDMLDSETGNTRLVPTQKPEVYLVIPQIVDTVSGTSGLQFVRIEPGGRAGPGDARFRDFNKLNRGPRVQSFKFGINGIFSFVFQPATFDEKDGNKTVEKPLVGVFVPGIKHPMPWNETTPGMQPISVASDHAQTHFLELEGGDKGNGGLHISVRMVVSNCGQPGVSVSLVVLGKTEFDKEPDAIHCDNIKAQRERYKTEVLPKLRFFQEPVQISGVSFTHAKLHRSAKQGNDHVYLLLRKNETEVFALPVQINVDTAIKVLTALQQAVAGAGHVTQAELTGMCYTMEKCKKLEINESGTDEAE